MSEPQFKSGLLCFQFNFLLMCLGNPADDRASTWVLVTNMGYPMELSEMCTDTCVHQSPHQDRSMPDHLPEVTSPEDSKRCSLLPQASRTHLDGTCGSNKGILCPLLPRAEALKPSSQSHSPLPTLRKVGQYFLITRHPESRPPRATQSSRGFMVSKLIFGLRLFLL